MLKIFVVRHGENQDNFDGILNWHRDLPLTEKWKNQAKVLGLDILNQGIVFDKIFSSPLLRAKQTAEIVSKTILWPKVEIIDALIERDFGVMTGKGINDIKKLCFPDIIETDKVIYFLKPDWWETFPDLLKRAKKVLDFLKSEFLDWNILLVCHGDIGKMLYAVYCGLEREVVLRNFHFDNWKMLILSN